LFRSKKAIEHFALSALQHEPFIGNPKVSSKLSRKGITLKISGDLLNSVNAKQQTANFLNQLKKDLRICLGISEQKKIKIRLVDFNELDANVHKSRVV
ncbi:alkaline shock response membrane anchor protein AmaP, partial [Furfurilactobacillus milii]|uniref:alkaline shock response membrane anchor protein AmaP n=1 Tax=Furfurilactobacillus milii TaxID=2888272 RepID=UPI001F20A23E